MPVRAMDEMRLILSKKQREDGTWYRPIFAAMPPNATRASNRAVGIHKPLRVPSPIVPPGLLSSGLSNLLDPFSMYVGGENHNTAAWDVRVMAGE
eukprot:1097911-Pleurochrysis_carterae.AAC.1